PVALFAALEKITPMNAQGEYYLTDALEVIKREDQCVAAYQYDRAEEILGINNRVELAAAGRKLRQQKLDSLMRAGVTIIDPDSTFIDTDVEIGADTTIYPQVMIEGATVIGEDCTLAPGVHIINCRLGNGVTVRDHSLVVDSFLDDQATVGPFAHLRMGAR